MHSGLRQERELAAFAPGTFIKKKSREMPALLLLFKDSLGSVPNRKGYFSVNRTAVP